ncbi:Hypothetical protein PAU_03476 [Photorhabdus asymbiotica]|uniref:Uncharacterized protein n=1 Tax=Photorhabdus asymbiotica subsp. asymbiotica (strain ATCC 43949 / 3105-77) TaxID=553480 RepID=C7BJN9_PHOAA|nr:Hypothetical protein PAU_03476 [Photorhabdus asymbiotica]
MNKMKKSETLFITFFPGRNGGRFYLTVTSYNMKNIYPSSFKMLLCWLFSFIPVTELSM